MTPVIWDIIVDKDRKGFRPEGAPRYPATFDLNGYRDLLRWLVPALEKADARRIKRSIEATKRRSEAMIDWHTKRIAVAEAILAAVQPGALSRLKKAERKGILDTLDEITKP